MHHELKKSYEELELAELISFMSLYFPIQILINAYLLKKTKRSAILFGPLQLIDLGLFIIVIIWINNVKSFKNYDETNAWAEEGDLGPEENAMINIIWYINCGNPHSKKDIKSCEKSFSYRFDYLLAAFTFLSWIKMISFFRASQTYGPMLEMTY